MIDIEEALKDRVLSVHDPEMRHGRKSASKRFNGHKAAVEMESQLLITGVEVLAGKAMLGIRRKLWSWRSKANECWRRR